ncbi:MAG: GH3 auxin-responsive promoter family protein [Bacteroidia bacterium]|nr:GH3 auxin-responsive promoter family protein [Bacteroidia bacterium]
MELMNSIFSWIMKKRIHQIELFIKYPHEVQNDWLKQLVQAADETEWGVKHGYKDIKNYNDFKRNVPLQDYNSLKPYIEKIRQGQQDILWNEEIKWFAKSSGTTNDKSKFIPVSISALDSCHYKGGKDLLSMYCNNNPETKLFSGKVLSMGGSLKTESYGNGNYHGDISAILMDNLPFWFQLIRTPDKNIALMDEWEEKIEKMAKYTAEDDVTSLVGVPSWMLVFINLVLEKANTKNLFDVWPNLELVIHGGVNFDPYKEQYNKLIPKAGFNYIQTYNASEGFFGIQDRNHEDDMLLMLDYGMFYEFIPYGADGEFDESNVLTLDQVEIGKNYALVISTNAGLWRYKIGDTITFTSTDPYRIKVSGRTAHFINAFGEEVIIDNAEKALQFACEKTGAVVREYTAAPIYFRSETNNGAHQWLIEFKKDPSDLKLFSEQLDTALKDINSDYEAKRYDNMVLDAPVIHKMPNDIFYHWLKQKNKLGGQHKIPRLSNNRKLVDEILSLQDKQY